MNILNNFSKKFNEIFIILPKDDGITRARKQFLYFFIGSIIGVILLSYSILSISQLGKKIVKVPNVEGLDVIEGFQLLSEKNLIAKPVMRYSDTVPKGIIIVQKNRKPGTSVKEGRIINLIVSNGPRLTNLGDYRGKTLFEVQAIFADIYSTSKKQINLDSYVYDYSPDFEKDMIFKQEPEAGTPMSEVKKIKFWISKGKDNVQILDLPDYVNKNIESAITELSKLDLIYRINFKETKNAKNDRIIYEQSPKPGTSIEQIINEDIKIILNFYSYKFSKKQGDILSGTFYLKIEEQPIPAEVKVILMEKNKNERILFQKKVRGGFQYPINYKSDSTGIIAVFINDELISETVLKEENSQTESL